MDTNPVVAKSWWGTAASIDEVSAFMSALQRSAFFSRVELKKTSAKTLDRTRVVDHWKANGLDLSPGMLRVAERHLRRLGLADRVHLQEGDATRLPYPDGHFQAVFLSFTLELFPDEEMPRVLAECRRVLAAGGRLGVVSLVKKEAAAVKIYEWFHAHLPGVVDCRPIRVRPLLEAAGFQVRQIVEERIWGLPAEAVLAVRT